jgi:hypothetical protein
MYKYILEAAGNINWMALFALLTFMFVFVVSAILILTKNTDTIKHIAELPLANDGEVTVNN